MLLTMVDPNRGHERAYNRWYERDHFYAGCMVGPWMFAGSRWVAPRQLKDLRWPHGDQVADPWDAGSYISIYWVEEGHHKEHFDEWAPTNGRRLYENGRGFAERTHIHTLVMDHIGASYRDDDPVPLALAFEYAYPGVVVAWMDGRDGTSAQELHAKLSAGLVPDLLSGSSIHSASSWTPSTPDAGPGEAPMQLGSAGGGRNRLVQLFFVGGDVRDEVSDLRAYTDAVQASGMADILLVAPFFRTVVGTDTYVDQLW